MIGWQSIETPPDVDQPVLLYAPNCRADSEGGFRWRQKGLAFAIGVRSENGQYTGDIVYFESGWESTGSYTVTVVLKPTHWMPLPEAPRS